MREFAAASAAKMCRIRHGICALKRTRRIAPMAVQALYPPLSLVLPKKERGTPWRKKGALCRKSSPLRASVCLCAGVERIGAQ